MFDNVCPFLSLFQFVILVIDSTDRERLSITKEELYKMLATEVSIQTSSTIDIKQNEPHH